MCFIFSLTANLHPLSLTQLKMTNDKKHFLHNYITMRRREIINGMRCNRTLCENNLKVTIQPDKYKILQTSSSIKKQRIIKICVQLDSKNMTIKMMNVVQFLTFIGISLAALIDHN